MTEKIDAAISNYRVMSAINRKAKMLTLSDKKYVAEFNLPFLGKKFKDYNLEIATYTI